MLMKREIKVKPFELNDNKKRYVMKYRKVNVEY